MKIAVVGTGYVGLVTGAGLAGLGHQVICIDKDTNRVEKIKHGLAPFFEPGLDTLVAETVKTGNLTASSDVYAPVQSAEVVLIAVGTPDHDGRIDLSQIEAAASEIGEALRNKAAYTVIAVKSTVVPGTTDGVVLKALEHSSAKKAGVEFGLCMNPEFLREGSAVEDFTKPDRIVIGAIDARAAAVFGAIYEKFDCPKPVVSLRNAEFCKYASNALLATLISFSNEMAALCEATPGADVEVALDCVHLDRRLSPVISGERVRPGILSYIRPSSGYGGSCFPKDVAALRAFARDRGVNAELLEAVSAVNDRRTAAVLDLAEARIGAFKGKRVGVLGLTFKSGTDDLRHSPAVTLTEQIINRGGDVSVYDPIATEIARSAFGHKVRYATGALDAVTGADVTVIGTAWPEWSQLDWTAVKRAMRGNIIFDARNSLRTQSLDPGLVRIQIGAGS
ncbi:MAG: UDP-glucose/GDP-mannose dehydrogenase family protein [Parvularculaceae bacterium]|nr:UDP-glucose/GDP-mannose dehydrogenase family protein [Parvularculaceae bacterium]